MNEWEAKKLFESDRTLYDQVVRGEMKIEDALLKTRKDESLTVPLEDWEWAADYVVDFVLDRFGPAVLIEVYERIGSIIAANQEEQRPITSAVAVPGPAAEPIAHKPRAKPTTQKFPIAEWRKATLDYLESAGDWVKPKDVRLAVTGISGRNNQTKGQSAHPAETAFKIKVIDVLIDEGLVEKRGERMWTEYRIKNKEG